jgi:hypothetical protein
VRRFEQEFERHHGRKVTGTDREPVAAELKEYRRLRNWYKGDKSTEESDNHDNQSNSHGTLGAEVLRPDDVPELASSSLRLIHLLRLELDRASVCRRDNSSCHTVTIRHAPALD